MQRRNPQPFSGVWPLSSRSTVRTMTVSSWHLMGMTGNIDARGGQVLFQQPRIRNVGHFGAHRMLPDIQREKRLGGDRFRLGGNFAIINPKCVWDAILEEKPYPVKMLFFISSNPLVTRANAKEVYRALEKVEFMAVSDFFLTPTAELCRYRPACGHMARDGLYRGLLEATRLPSPPKKGDPGRRMPLRPRDAQ